MRMNIWISTHVWVPSMHGIWLIFCMPKEIIYSYLMCNFRMHCYIIKASGDISISIFPPFSHSISMHPNWLYFHRNLTIYDGILFTNLEVINGLHMTLEGDEHSNKCPFPRASYTSDLAINMFPSPHNIFQVTLKNSDWLLQYLGLQRFSKFHQNTPSSESTSTHPIILIF